MNLSVWRRLLILALLCLGALSHAEDDGGGDGGGGRFIFSGRQEIIQTTRRAWAELTSGRIENPLYSAQEVISLKENKTADDAQALRMLVKMTGIQVDTSNLLVDSANPPNLDTDPMVAMRAKSIHFRDDAPCAAPNIPDAFASVTKKNLSGELCVSLFEIGRYPTASLRYDIIAILVHEIAHLSGYEEADAVAIQHYFLKNMPAILHQDNAASYNILIIQSLNLARSWPAMIRYKEIDQNYIYRSLNPWVHRLSEIWGELEEPHKFGMIHPVRSDYFPRLEEVYKSGRTHSAALYQYWVKTRNANFTAPVSAEALKLMKACIADSFDLEGMMAIFLRGENSRSKWWNAEFLNAMKATDPVALTIADPDNELKGNGEKNLYFHTFLGEADLFDPPEWRSNGF